VLQWRSRHWVFYREVTVNELREFLEARKEKYGTLQDLAISMDLSYSGLLRGVKAGTLDEENCLRLAEVLGEEPPIVCRAAKKPKLADQLDRLYGRVKPPDPKERKLLDAWRTLTEKSRDIIWMTMNALPRTDGKQQNNAPTPKPKRHSVVQKRA
jgi:hypothetical protein